MDKKILYSLLLSTFILAAPSKAQEPWASSGVVDLTTDMTLSKQAELPAQTDDLTIDGNGHGIDGGGHQLYRYDNRLSTSPHNPTKDEASITLQNLGSFSVQAGGGSDTYQIIDLDGIVKSINITNEGLHNFKWGADDTPSSVTENSALFYHMGDVSIIATVIKDNMIDHGTSDYGGRDGGAITWKNDIEYGDDWEIESETGKVGFTIKDSLIIHNGIKSVASDEEKFITGGAFQFEGSGENNVSNTVSIDNSYFINNYIDTQKSEYAQGGAIYASGINNFKVTNSYFGENSTKGADTAGGAVYIDDSEVYDNPYTFEKTVFNKNFAQSITTNGTAQGGAINAYYYTKIKDSLFEGNYVESKSKAKGGALYLESDDYDEFSFEIDNTKFNNNSAKTTGTTSSESKGGAIYNDGYATTVIKDSTFTNNSVQTESETEVSSGATQGGAIYNETDGDLTIVDSTLKGNKAVGSNAAGGGVFNAEDATLTIVAENKDVVFEDNKSGSDEGNLVSDGITDAGGVVNLNAYEGKSIYLNDRIISYKDAENQGTININKSQDGSNYTGSVVLNNDMKSYTGTVNLEGGTLAVGQNGTLFEQAQAFNVNAPSNLNVANGHIGTYNLGNVNLKSDLNAQIDADLQNGTVDKFDATKVEGNGKLRVDNVNLLNDMVDGVDYKDMKLTDNEELQDVITLTDNAKQAFTPIWSYNVDYSDGEMRFTRGDKVEHIIPPTPDNPSGSDPSQPGWKAFNPSVLSSVVAAQAGAVATMNTGFYYGMFNSENYMNFSKSDRLAYKTRNRYAINSSSQSPFSPLHTRRSLDGSWFRAYSTFENIPLDNGPKVQNISYGAYMGYDSEIVDTERGWERSWTGYVSYNGANQKFMGVNSTLNGASLGATLSLYKGNFFNALTVSAGSIVGDSHNMYGKEDYTMFIAGLADRMGYNFEFFEGKFIIQPSLLLGYTFVNTFDYTNSANVRIDSDPLSVMQISPGTKFIMNTKNGWQPYLGVNMIWNIINSSEVTANSVLLPEMSIKPYIQYGLGVQKIVNSDFMFFAQAMIQNGGRNGVSLSAGLRWALGKDKSKVKVKKNKQSKFSFNVLKFLAHK